MDVIALDEAKAHLRVDFDDDDLVLGRMVSAANAHVSALVYPDAEDEPETPPADIVQAALLIVGHWYMNRENAAEGALVDIPLIAAEILANHRAWSFG